MTRARLTDEQRRRTRHIMAQALQRAHAARRAFVVAEASDDDAVAAEVLSLLEHDERCGDFLAATPELPGSIAGDEATVGANADEVVGTIIDRYRVVEKLGEGGFGTVYRAEQQEPVRRSVALKIIKPGMDSRQIVTRFEAERQALAMMAHPGIATVFDGGTTNQGRPYFVMELVRGVPLTTYCDEAGLDTAQRLRLFIDLCRAVQHAHLKGVIHRDLKPSNVLVTLQDGEPAPRVIDFGIAKATSGSLADRPAGTELYQFIGTPEYMSPEQAETTGIDVDTRSDVYTLGVILYEMLTGVTPLDSTRLREAGPLECGRIVREEEPARPSTRVGQLVRATQATASEAAARRSTRPDELQRRLRGDLDWIVMKALEKDRARRYDTAAALAEDVQRHLDDEPILASPPSASYRIRKFARRNRGLFIAGSAVVAVLTVGIVGTTGGLIWALAESERATNEADRATREMVRAREIKNVMAELLGSFDLNLLAGEEGAVMRTILEETASRVALDRIEDPLIEAETRAVIIGMYARLGMDDEAEQHVEILRSRILPGRPDHLATAAAYQSIGEFRYRQHRMPESEAALREALRIRRDRLGNDHPDTFSSAIQLGRALHAQLKFDEARALLAEGVAGRKRVLGEDDPNTLVALSYLAFTLEQVGERDRAIHILRLVHRTRQRVLGPDNPSACNAGLRLGMRLDESGRLDESYRLLTESVAGLRRTCGDDHPDTMIAVNLACDRFVKRGRYSEALPMLEATESTARRVYAGRPELGEFVYKLARCRLEAGSTDTVAVLLEEARELMAPDSMHAAGLRETLARVRDRRDPA